MKVLLRPGTALLNNLRYPQKFLLISLVFLIPLFGLGYLLQAEMASQIHFVDKERQGLSDIDLVRRPLALIQQHRGLSAGFHGGNRDFLNDIRSKAAEVDQTLENLDRLASADASSKEIAGKVKMIQRDWQRLSGSVTGMTAAQSFESHTALIDKLFELTGLLAEASNLILDPEVDTFYLIDLVVNKFPSLTESMGQARGIGAGVAAAGTHQGRSWADLAVRQDRIVQQLNAFEYNLERVFSYKPELGAKLKELGDQTKRSIRNLSDLVQTQLLDPETLSVSAGDVVRVGTQAINQVFDVFDQTLPVLDGLMAARKGRFAQVRTITLAVMALALLVVLYLFLSFYRGVIDSIEEFQETTGKLGEGDLTARFNIRGKDELAGVAQSLNVMVSGFEKVVKHVIQSTEQVAQAAEELSAVTEQTAAGVSQQRAETQQVASAMSELSATVREVACNTVAAAEAANQANSEAGEGRGVLQEMVAKVNVLAEAMEDAGQVMTQLQSQSSEIGTVLEVINGIAEQTNLLALNAAIEAARAGEGGRGFAVVADEVRSLAARTQSSTEEIDATIEKLRCGAADAVKVIELSRKNTGESVELAKVTGRSLESILERVAVINDMNTQIASAADQQTTVADEMNLNVENIAGVAEQAATASGQTAESSQNLSLLSQELLQSVVHFKVA
ncbi:methyl-accepting chemotaxis protein [Marinobacter sp. Arc7-DN-1]|uniref:methyl-accepting chemotaxis protein n=1 Tax=Marinobacter sp. Arc7-DN-1 TaxID=2304594 RepID=UPI000E437ABF|nr:methyl-accepting chemotaxis protein [Marinobacter sp. Arc7-DN-1]AXS82984.1 methyl-accepting chemotaxis protein [Marinobacter sp. Arc7-DN-1]